MEFITVLGNLGADPQTKESLSRSFVTFPVYVDKYRQGKKVATVYQIAVFNDSRRFCSKRLKAGDKVMVAGTLDVRITHAKRTFLNIEATEVFAVKGGKQAAQIPARTS
jgi:single-stranded DNA-binding protein